MHFAGANIKTAARRSEGTTKLRLFGNWRMVVSADERKSK
jgi:hypothetical protein